MELLKRRMNVSEPRSYARRLVKGTAIVFVALVASGFISLFLRMFLARALTVAEYGLFYAIFAFVSLFAIFRDLGLNFALVKHIPEFAIRKQFDRIKSSVVFVILFQLAFAGLIATTLLTLSGPIASVVFKTEAAVLPLSILCAWFFTAVFFGVFRHAFQGFQNMPAYASMDFSNTLFILLSALLFVGLLGYGVSGAAYAYLLAILVISAAGFAFFRKGYPQVCRAKASISKPLAKKLFIFALPVLLGGLGGLIVGYTDTLTITIFRTLPEVGFYQTAQPAARVLWYFSMALTAILFPVVSELWTKRKRKLLGDVLHFLTKFSFILIIPAALVFIAFPGIIIQLLFGPGYLPGATAFQILSAAAIIYTLYAILIFTIAGIGKPIINAKIVAVMACLNLAGNLLLVPPYGIEGAAVATLSSYLLALVLLFYYARKFVGFTVPSLPILKAVIGGVFTLLLIFSLKHVIVLPPWPEAFAVMVPSLVFYGVWVLATRVVTKSDLRLIARIVPMPERFVKVARKFIG